MTTTVCPSVGRALFFGESDKIASVIFRVLTDTPFDTLHIFIFWTDKQLEMYLIWWFITNYPTSHRRWWREIMSGAQLARWRIVNKRLFDGKVDVVGAFSRIRLHTRSSKLASIFPYFVTEVSAICKSCKGCNYRLGDVSRKFEYLARILYTAIWRHSIRGSFGESRNHFFEDWGERSTKGLSSSNFSKAKDKSYFSSVYFSRVYFSYRG